MTGRRKALSLYKSLLRAHAKYLPEEMRSLGDAYVKAEFRLHKSVTNTDQLNNFFSEWGKYLSHVEQTGREKQSKSIGLVDSPSMGPSPLNSSGPTTTNKETRFGKDLTGDVELNDEQEGQLKKLREETLKRT